MHKPNRPLGRLRWRHEFAQRIEHLLELGSRVAAEGVVTLAQRLGLVLKLGQPLGQIGMRGRQRPHPHKGAHDLDVYAYVGGNPLSLTDPMGLAGGTGGGNHSGSASRCTCSEKQFSIGAGLSVGGGPTVWPAGFVGGGASAGVTSNGALFVQGQVTMSTGVGIYAGVGVQGGVSYSKSSTPAGVSVSDSLQADFNFGAGASVGASGQLTPESGGGLSTGMPGMGKFGAGYGMQASVGVTRSVTIATPAFLDQSSGCP